MRSVDDTGRTVRRLARHLRVQPNLVGKLKSRVQDPALSETDLLKVLPASLPIRLAGETDTNQLSDEQDRAAQREQMEGLLDDRARPFRSLEDDNDKDVKRKRLGEPLDTIPEEVVGVETSDIMTDDTAPLQKPSTRSEEGIVESREVHIKHLLVTGAVKDWNNEDAIKTGAKILSGHKEKSRWCAREFATYKFPSVSAAASDADNTSSVDLVAVKKGSRHHVLRPSGRFRSSS